MKKVISLLLALMLTFVLAGCGGGGSNSDASTPAGEQQTSTDSNPSDATSNASNVDLPKQISAFGVTIGVDETWLDFDVSTTSFQRFDLVESTSATSTNGEDIHSGTSEIKVISHAEDVVTADFLSDYYKGMAVTYDESIVTINGVEMLQFYQSNPEATTYYLYPRIDGSILLEIHFRLNNPEYEANRDLYDAMINSIVIS